ncbi:MAG: UPF0058 family protein [Halapricum sp.]
MKKQELVHLHSLVVQFARYFESETDSPIPCEEYAKLGVTPASIHRSKTAHEAALLALLDCVVTEIEAKDERNASHISY